MATYGRARVVSKVKTTSKAKGVSVVPLPPTRRSPLFTRLARGGATASSDLTLLSSSVDTIPKLASKRRRRSGRTVVVESPKRIQAHSDTDPFPAQPIKKQSLPVNRSPRPILEPVASSPLAVSLDTALLSPLTIHEPSPSIYQSPKKASKSRLKNLQSASKNLSFHPYHRQIQSPSSKSPINKRNKKSPSKSVRAETDWMAMLWPQDARNKPLFGSEGALEEESEDGQAKPIASRVDEVDTILLLEARVKELESRIVKLESVLDF
ncbi:hypothetical protein HDU79_006242 [Rhizoclosmatium sp. JEL0117]|nr:hypothetical protein HDU79_006242 [Rhizoclosmatium sp. JEL0117]